MVVDLMETYFGWIALVAGVAIIVITVSNWRRQRSASFSTQPQTFPQQHGGPGQL
jgi:hypothetical protein